MDTTTTPDRTPGDRKPAKPQKPWPGFPLFWHTRGYWCVKRGGKQIPYTADAHESHQRFLKDEEDRAKGIARRPATARTTLADAVRLFMDRQLLRLQDGEIGNVQFVKYRRELAGDKGAGVEGHLARSVPLSTPLLELADPRKASTHFALLRTRALARGRHAAERHVVCVRALLDWASDQKLMEPPAYGDWFDVPANDPDRSALFDADSRAWTIDELRRIIEVAEARAKARRGNERNPALWAMVLLGLNCGYGSEDLCVLPEAAVYWDKLLIAFPRVKNGRQRCCPLWEETAAAVRFYLEQRPRRVAEARSLLFVSKHGTAYTTGQVRQDASGRPTAIGRTDVIGKSFLRLLEGSGVRRPHGAGFYTLRAHCRSLLVGSGADEDLVRVIMGRRFRYRLDEYYLRADLREKLVAVAEHARLQVFTPSRRELPLSESGFSA